MVQIVLEGPGKNALGTELILGLTAQLKAAAGAPLLVTGVGNAFSAGLDLREIARLDAPGLETFLGRLERLITALYQYPGPVVAHVNGHAIAGGCVLALCCDRRIVASEPRLRMGLNEVALGLRFPPRTLEIVRRRVPTQHHEEVLLGAGLFGPPEAARVGLVDLVSDDAAAVAAKEVARLSAFPAGAYADLKRALRGSSPEQLRGEADWQREVQTLLPAWGAPELKQKLLALLDK